MREVGTEVDEAHRFTSEEVEQYHRDGFLMKKGMFADVIDELADTVLTDAALPYYMRDDSSGFSSRLSILNRIGVNVYGALARSARLLDNAETLLGGYSHSLKDAPEEAYHYHTKVIVKEPQKGGAWEWHQDYGYWYQNGCLYPRMLSIVIPLTEHTLANGCLSVLRGSHWAGRMTHVTINEQQGVDPERLRYVIRDYEEVVLECSPGDAHFFHCNLFHASLPHRTDRSRASIITSYNARSNDPVRKHHHPCYSPLDRWGDTGLHKLIKYGYRDGDGSEANDPTTEVYNAES